MSVLWTPETNTSPRPQSHSPYLFCQTQRPPTRRFPWDDAPQSLFSPNGSRSSQNPVENTIMNGDFLISFVVGNKVETRHVIPVYTATTPEDFIQSTRDTSPNSASSSRKKDFTYSTSCSGFEFTHSRWSLFTRTVNQFTDLKVQRTIIPHCSTTAHGVSTHRHDHVISK